MYYRTLHAYKNILYALIFIVAALFVAISLFTFHKYDTSFLYSVIQGTSAPIRNYLGMCGAYSASFLLYIFGAAAWLLVPIFFLAGCMNIAWFNRKKLIRMMIGCVSMILGVCFLSIYCGGDLYNCVSAGGYMGHTLYGMTCSFCDEKMYYYLSFFFLCLGLLFCFGLSWGSYVIHTADVLFSLLGIKGAVSIFVRESEETIFEDPFWHEYMKKMEDTVCGEEVESEICSPVLGEIEAENAPFVIPGIDTTRSKNKSEVTEEDVLVQERARHLEMKLELFGIKGEVVSITRGPVVTLFEYAPASDVKISKIVMLEDDLALALQAYSLRILAPIPGRSVVGFEVANVQRQTVHFADIAASKDFKKFQGSIPLIIGKDTVGNDVTVDLIDTPHLLVAGSTGSGKSVALNAMLMSILCKVHPDEVKLILIDPKRLEFSHFADISHLLFPIITDIVLVPRVLQWAVKTMEERYAQLAESGARHIQEYHKQHGVQAMPFMVIVIDELADLMMSSHKVAHGADIEYLIARLSQMARAAGIHLILATQRPSVDVITGLIKVNFPSRIACKVISKVDSRTILDQSGAEKLLGKGDMLFLNHKGILTRVHGAYVKDEEIVEVVRSIKKQRRANYCQLDIPQDQEVYDDHQEDPLYTQVCEYVVSVEQVSISLLQRKFRIGYNRSARLIDTLESRGVLMPADGSKFRKVLR